MKTSKHSKPEVSRTSNGPIIIGVLQSVAAVTLHLSG
jgi:hypothetical protein